MILSYPYIYQYHYQTTVCYRILTTHFSYLKMPKIATTTYRSFEQKTDTPYDRPSEPSRNLVSRSMRRIARTIAAPANHLWSSLFGKKTIHATNTTPLIGAHPPTATPHPDGAPIDAEAGRTFGEVATHNDDADCVTFADVSRIDDKYGITYEDVATLEDVAQPTDITLTDVITLDDIINLKSADKQMNDALHLDERTEEDCSYSVGHPEQTDPPFANGITVDTAGLRLFSQDILPVKNSCDYPPLHETYNSRTCTPPCTPPCTPYSARPLRKDTVRCCDPTIPHRFTYNLRNSKSVLTPVDA